MSRAIPDAAKQCARQIEGHCQGVTSDNLTYGTHGTWIVDPVTNNNRFTRVPSPICVPCLTYLTFTERHDPFWRMARAYERLQEAMYSLGIYVNGIHK